MNKWIIAFCGFVVTVKVQAAPPQPFKQFYDWAPTPPMGWNSWDCFGAAATEAIVLSNADYIVKNLKSHGYDTVVIDGRWCRPDPSKANKMGGMDLEMDENGRLRPTPTRFPSARETRSFKPIADAVHAKGLKFGIHILRGIPRQAVKKNVPILGVPGIRATDIANTNSTCPWSDDTYRLDFSKPGAQAYYDSVFALLASWEIDFIKVDDLVKPYSEADVEALRHAIDKTGRPIVFSTSPGPLPANALGHVTNYANMWRMSGDFWDVWSQLHNQFAGLAAWADRPVTRGFIDADMLPVGSLRLNRPRPPGGHWTRFTHDEQITLMTLWCIARSPLFAGGNLPDNDPWTLSLLTNEEVLAVDQHSEGNRQFFSRYDQIGWTARVPDSKDVYVALFNASPEKEIEAKPVVLTAHLADLGIQGRCNVRDLWSHKDLAVACKTISATIPSHGAVLYRLHPNP
jgi:alpha-galactosidase